MFGWLLFALAIGGQFQVEQQFGVKDSGSDDDIDEHPPVVDWGEMLR